MKRRRCGVKCTATVSTDRRIYASRNGARVLHRTDTRRATSKLKVAYNDDAVAVRYSMEIRIASCCTRDETQSNRANRAEVPKRFHGSNEKEISHALALSNITAGVRERADANRTMEITTL